MGPLSLIWNMLESRNYQLVATNLSVLILGYKECMDQSQKSEQESNLLAAALFDVQLIINLMLWCPSYAHVVHIEASYSLSFFNLPSVLFGVVSAFPIEMSDNILHSYTLHEY